ncbi:MAG: hypothetical protein HY815_06350 [Candidatus Riflebacteria bacterium]|nr:hypothetical protein [Candidatus Riflebacteria bacterium]
MASQKRVLLTNCPRPYPEHPPDRDGMDQYGLRITKHQQLFQVPIEYPFQPALHLIARNLGSAQVTVLDGPDRGLLTAELSRKPDLVGISFPTPLTPLALDAARLARRVAPDAGLVLGGHGVMTVPSPGMDSVEVDGMLKGVAPGSVAFESARELGRLAHRVCRGDGVSCVRELLGERPDAPIDATLPPTGLLRPFGLSLVSPRNMISLAPSLGCSGGCDFCTTGSFFKKRIVLVTPDQAHASIRNQLRRVRPGDYAYGVILDEDLMADRPWFEALGRRLGDDPLVHSTGFTFTTFGSVRTIGSYDPADLVRWRVNNIWIGVETTFEQTGVGYLERKKEGRDAEVFSRIHGAGITTCASLILGWDFHDAESVGRDVDRFLELEPTSAQVLPLIPVPGTRLWSRMVDEGRITPVERWEDVHYYSRLFRYSHFAVDDLWRLEDDVERRLYAEQGPFFLKMVQVYLRGLGWLRSAHPGLDSMAQVYRRLLRELRPTLPSVIRFAPSAAVASKAAAALAEVDGALGAPSLSQRAKGLALWAYNLLRSDVLGISRPYQPPTNRTVYRGGRIVESTWGGESWEVRP